MAVKKMSKPAMKNKWSLILIISLAVAGLFSLMASSFPDGLEASARHLGLTISPPEFSALLSNYAMPGIANQTLARSLAGIIGTLFVFILVYLIIWLLNKNHRNT